MCQCETDQGNGKRIMWSQGNGFLDQCNGFLHLPTAMYASMSRFLNQSHNPLETQKTSSNHHCFPNWILKHQIAMLQSWYLSGRSSYNKPAAPAEVVTPRYTVNTVIVASQSKKSSITRSMLTISSDKAFDSSDWSCKKCATSSVCHHLHGWL